MPFHPDSPGVEIDPITIEGEHIAVERSLIVRDSGIIATIRITPLETPPIKYQLVDPFPGAFDVEEIGFHPDHQPSHGRVDPHEIVIGGVLETEDGQIVKYGLCPLDGESPEMVRSVQSDNLPAIGLEEAIESATADDVEFETPAIEETTDRGGLYSSFKRSVFGRAPADTTVVSSHASATDTTDSEEAAEAVAEAISDLESEADDASAAPTEGPDTVEELFGQDEPNEAPDRGPRDEVRTEDVSTATPSDQPINGPDASVIDRLIAELRTGAAADDRRDALAEELDSLLGAEDQPLPRSIEVRLQQMESRMEEFSAYTSALRDLIDEHGTASEFITEIHEELEQLDTEIAGVRDTLEQTTTDLQALEEAHHDVEAHVESLDESFDEMAETAADERSAIKADLRDIERTIDDLEREAADARDELSTKVDDLLSDVTEHAHELDALREDVEEERARRKAIAQALSGDLVESDE